MGLHPVNAKPDFTPVANNPLETLRERRRLGGELMKWEDEFERGARQDATPREIQLALGQLNVTAAQIVNLVRDFEARFVGSIAAPSLGKDTAFRAQCVADALMYGLTEDAARVLNAAVKRELV